jgi:hypothetical protein
MPPPPSYLDITSLPFSQLITQADFNGGTYGGTAEELWLRYVSPGNVIIGWYVNAGGTFTPQMTIFKSDGSTQVAGSNNATWWVYLDADTFYIRVRRVGLGPSDFDFTVDVEDGPIASQPLPTGAILINDDSRITGTDPHTGEGYPSTAWLSDGTFLGFVPGIVAGEHGDRLPTGEMLWHNRFGSGGSFLKLHDASANLVATTDTSSPSFNIGTGFGVMFNNGTDFYVGAQSGGNLVVSKVDRTTGAVTPHATVALGGGTITGAGISQDGDTIYFVTTFSHPTIKQWSVSGGALIADLYTVPGTSDEIAVTGINGFPHALLTLSDGSVATWWRDYGTNVDTIIRVSASGTLIASHALPTNTVIDRMHYNPASADHVTLRVFPNNNDSTSEIGDFSLATGAYTQSFLTDNFSAGVSRITAGTQKFGPSASCMMITAGYIASTTSPPEPVYNPCCEPCPSTNPGGSTPTGGGGAIPPDDPIVPGVTLVCTAGGIGPSGLTPTDPIVWSL